MTQKNILFWPSHDPRQYSAVADELEFMNPDLNFFFFLLEEPKFEFKYNYITYEQLVDTGSKINKSFYDINLNELLHVDRIHKSLKIAESCLPKYLLSIEKFLIDKNIDCIIGYALSDSITLGAFKVSQRLKIKYYYLLGSKISNYFYLSSSLNAQTERLSMNSFSRKQTSKLVFDIIEQNQVPQYASDPTMLISKPLIQSFKNLLGYTKEKLSRKNKYLNARMPFKRAILNKLNRYFAYSQLLKFSKNLEDLKDLKYIYFPLHLHPETATLIWGRWIHNQIEIIKLLSRVLPDGYHILVKEHKVAAGRRPLYFYKEIASLPKTYFINMEENSHEVIRKSAAVATISGTAGFESLCHKKNLLLFGDIDYGILPNVIKSTDLSRLRSNVYQALQKPTHDISESDIFLDYITTRVNSSELIDHYSATSVDQKTVKGLARLFNSAIIGT